MANQITPSGVAEIMRTRFNVEVTYFRAWKGRKEALRDLRGDFEESYNHLPLVGEMIREKNRGYYFFFAVLLIYIFSLIIHKSVKIIYIYTIFTV